MIRSSAVRRSARTVIFLGFLLACTVGCGGQRAYPVEGTVVFADGKPVTGLAGGSVLFNSDEARLSGNGEIDQEGRFRVTMRRKDDGLPPGTYQVAVMPPDPDEGDDAPAKRRRKPVIDPRFHDLTTSKLVVTIKPERNDLKLTVEPPK